MSFVSYVNKIEEVQPPISFIPYRIFNLHCDEITHTEMYLCQEIAKRQVKPITFESFRKLPEILAVHQRASTLRELRRNQ